eukprot:TRINITY_DN66779_c0_g1_i1.p1 TRINITY_DN66779_c0_g1~~TRINITY_DN66779_c0_g1_i1.p1  ORF type:complete len:153 (-),score=15.68 TRINITY_DN66779_c0_g1_i1:10-468(-)
MAEEAKSAALSEGVLNTSISIVQHLSDHAIEINTSIYVPNLNGVLALAMKLVYNDAPWLSFDKKYDFVHPKLSNDVAMKVGVSSLRSRLLTLTSQALSISLKSAESFGQSEPLTRRLQHILALYAEGPSVLYEIGRAVQQECRDRSRMPSSA